MTIAMNLPQNYFNLKLSQWQKFKQLRNNQANKSYALDFTTNDYLKLSNHPQVIDAVKQGVEKWGLGAKGARLLGGRLPIYNKFEHTLATMHKTEKALLFNNGYVANNGGLTELGKAFDIIYMDKLCHASLIDGVIASKTRWHRYPHLDLQFLEHSLKQGNPEKSLVVTETLFSMDGDFTPLEHLWELQSKYKFWVYIDSAHSFGAYPIVFKQLLNGGIPNQKIFMGSFGKALGGHGAFITASQVIIDYLINTVRSFIYSTVLPPSTIKGVSQALNISLENPEYTDQLLKISNYFLKKLPKKNMTLTSSHIVPFIVHSSSNVLDLCEYLKQKSIQVGAIRYPTVPQNTARIRFSLHRKISKQDIDFVLNQIPPKYYE